MRPTTAPITQEYGNNFLVNGAWAYPPGGHNGMDFGLSYGIYVAPYPMTILSTGWDSSGFGNLIKARDTLGFTHWFAHNSKYLVSPGQSVAMGQPLGVSGNTGFSTAPHLHWGVQAVGYSGYNGYINPRNWPGFNAQGVEMAEVLGGAGIKDWNIEAIVTYLNYLVGRPRNVESYNDVRKNHAGKSLDQINKDFLVDNPNEYDERVYDAYTELLGPPVDEKDETQRKADVVSHRKAGQPYAQVYKDLAKAAVSSKDDPRIAEIERIIHEGR